MDHTQVPAPRRIVVHARGASAPGPAGIPAVLVGDPATARATVLLRYGLGAQKEVQIPEALRLATAGFAVLIPEAPHHGERADGWLDRIGDLGTPAGRRPLHELVARTAAETPALIDDLRARGAAGIVAAGISFGGFVSLATPAADPRTCAVVALLASPVWDDRPDSPHLHPTAWDDVPLFAVTADHDRTVEPGPMREFTAALRRRSTRRAAIDHATYPGDHTMAEADWHDAWGRIITWLDGLTVGVGGR